MRPMREHIYFLSDNVGSCIAQVKSGVKINAGDELNWNGNKVLVESIYANVLVTKKIGFAITVESVKEVNVSKEW